MNNRLRKNILDLSYNKYLLYVSLSVMLITMYLVALLIATLTNQIQTQFIHFIILILTSIIILTPASGMLIHSLHHLKRIPQLIGELDPNTKI